MQGQRALLLYPPGLDFVTAFFGCLYAGSDRRAGVSAAAQSQHGRGFRRSPTTPKRSCALTLSDVIDRTEGLLDETPDLQPLAWISTDKIPDSLAEKWKPTEDHRDSWRCCNTPPARPARPRA